MLRVPLVRVALARRGMVRFALFRRGRVRVALLRVALVRRGSVRVALVTRGSGRVTLVGVGLVSVVLLKVVLLRVVLLSVALVRRGVEDGTGMPVATPVCPNTGLKVGNAPDAVASCGLDVAFTYSGTRPDETVPAEPVPTADAGVGKTTRVTKRVDVAFEVVVVVSSGPVTFSSAGSVGRSGFVKISGRVASGARVSFQLNSGGKALAPVPDGASAGKIAVPMLVAVAFPSGWVGMAVTTISVCEGGTSTFKLGSVTLSVRCSPLARIGRKVSWPAEAEVVVAEIVDVGSMLVDGVESAAWELGGPTTAAADTKTTGKETNIVGIAA
jgi:hypothetical protein